MSCQFINDNIINFLEHKLGESDLDKFNSHLATCNSCQHVITEVQLTYHFAKKPVNFRISDDFVENTIARIKKPETRVIDLVYNVLKPIAVAASIGLGILIGNGELSMLENNIEYTEEESIVLSVAAPSDYSLWQSLDESYGNEN